MSIRENNIRPVNSLNVFLCCLSKLSDMFSIDTVTGYFPHLFNTRENQKYIGAVPDKSMFGDMNMMPKNKEASDEWYEGIRQQTDWNFREEFIKYCRADVDLLAKSVLEFRKIFKSLFDVDPFRYITLASLCMDIYKNNFLPEKTVVACNGKKQSTESLE
jgi:hypothetical protein